MMNAKMSAVSIGFSIIGGVALGIVLAPAIAAERPHVVDVQREVLRFHTADVLSDGTTCVYLWDGGVYAVTARDGQSMRTFDEEGRPQMVDQDRTCPTSAEARAEHERSLHAPQRIDLSRP